MSETEAVQPFLASFILRLYLTPSKCGAEKGDGKPTPGCVRSIICQAGAVFLLVFVALGSELKIDFPKKAPFRWSYQGNLHYHLPASRLIWNSPAFDMLHFFSGAAAFSQQTPRRYSP